MVRTEISGADHANGRSWRKADVSRSNDVSRQVPYQPRTSALLALGRYTNALARK
jgi:hypothetical protein